MNKFTHSFGFTTVLALVIGLLTMNCANADNLDLNLNTPKNVRITVDGRTMTVTWDAVKNARGYEIVTSSTDCNSGKRLINTKDKTAKNNTEGSDNFGKNALLNDKSNGAVEIKGKTKIEITLMPNANATEPNTTPMASEVSAKVKALGGKVGGNEYLDSEYSELTTKTLSGGMGM